MKCFVNWIPANSHVRSSKTQSYLKTKKKCLNSGQSFDLLREESESDVTVMCVEYSNKRQFKREHMAHPHF